MRAKVDKENRGLRAAIFFLRLLSNLENAIAHGWHPPGSA